MKINNQQSTVMALWCTDNNILYCYLDRFGINNWGFMNRSHYQYNTAIPDSIIMHPKRMILIFQSRNCLVYHIVMAWKIQRKLSTQIKEK